MPHLGVVLLYAYHRRMMSGCSIASPFTTAGKNIPALVSHEALNAVKSKFKEEEYEAADKKEAQADCFHISASTREEKANDVYLKQSLSGVKRKLRLEGQELVDNLLDADPEELNLFRTAGTNSIIPLRESSIKRARQQMEQLDENEPKEDGSIQMGGEFVGNTALASSLLSTPKLALPGLRFFTSAVRSNSPFRPPMRVSMNGSLPSPHSPLIVPSASPTSHPSRDAPSSTLPNESSCVTPISDIQSTSTSFRVHGRVSECAGRVVVYGREPLPRFSFSLTDQEGTTLEVEAVAELAAETARTIQFGKSYEIMNGDVTKQRPSRDNEKGILISINNQTKIVPSSAEVDGPKLRNRRILVPIPELTHNANEELDVAGVVQSVEVGSDSSSRQIELKDPRGSVTLDLRDEYVNVKVEKGQLLMINRCAIRKSQGNQVKICSIPGRSRIMLEPFSEDGRLNGLRVWRDKHRESSA